MVWDLGLVQIFASERLPQSWLLTSFLGFGFLVKKAHGLLEQKQSRSLLRRFLARAKNYYLLSWWLLFSSITNTIIK